MTVGDLFWRGTRGSSKLTKWAYSSGERPVSKRHRMVAGAFAFVLTVTLGVGHDPVGATGTARTDFDTGRTQSAPAWMSPEYAARLDLGFSVLAPGVVPAPFAGEPSVYAAGGYYSLYWVIYGGPPTFLEVTGEIGGDIPDGSAYDLNVPLVVNASVQGYPAFHDVTPIYDTVWWQAGDTVYKVSAQGLTGTDSLSLANSLALMAPPESSGDGAGDAGPGETDPETEAPDGGGQGPAPDAEAPGGGLDPDLGESPAPLIVLPEVVVSGEVASIAVEGVSGATLEADAGSFPDTGSRVYAGVGGFSFTWQAPSVTSDITLGFVLVDVSTGEWLATASTQVLASGTEGIAADPDGVEGAGSGAEDDPDVGDGTGSPAPGPVRPGTTTSNLTGTIAMTCPTVAYSGRLMPIKLAGASPAIANATLGGWPVEPGNLAFDPNVDGGPALIGGVSDDAATYLHWRAPNITEVTLSRFFLTHPDGTALAECSVSVQPGEPPARRPTPRSQGAPEHDGSGGPFPFTSSEGEDAIAVPEASGLEGDGSGGPVAADGDGTQGPDGRRRTPD